MCSVVSEIFDLEIFSYSNNCLKFKRVKFSHREFKRAKICTRNIMYACMYVIICTRHLARVEDEYIIIIIVVAVSILNYFQAQGRSA